jgi:DNA polymerase-1
MKWIEVDEQTALRWAYIQCLVGDKTDNIEGIKGVGPAKAEKILAGCVTHNDCWEAVVNAFDQSGKNMMEAIETMRLVNMYQLTEIDGQLQIKLWRPNA